MSTLEKAIEISNNAHKGQRDKAGKPYILHPLRLMLQMATEEEMIVAVLHDVVEDSSLTLQKLRDWSLQKKKINPPEQNFPPGPWINGLRHGEHTMLMKPAGWPGEFNPWRSDLKDS